MRSLSLHFKPAPQHFYFAQNEPRHTAPLSRLRQKSMKSRASKKSLSLIREFHLADWFTLGNAICGTAALFATITYVQTAMVGHLYLACVLILAALVFDVLDGRIARWRQKSSS